MKTPRSSLFPVAVLDLFTVVVIICVIVTTAFCQSSSKPCSEAPLEQLKQKAAQGSASAQRQLGDMFAEGRCVPQDYAQAAPWYRRSAMQGDPEAEFQLAMFLLEGKEVPQDATEAAVWFRRAADQNHHRAQYALGSLYVQGRGLPKDMIQGYEWVRVSAPKSDAHTRDVLATLSKSMTQHEVDEAEARAQIWLDAHAETSAPRAPNP